MAKGRTTKGAPFIKFIPLSVYVKSITLTVEENAVASKSIVPPGEYTFKFQADNEEKPYASKNSKRVQLSTDALGKIVPTADVDITITLQHLGKEVKVEDVPPASYILSDLRGFTLGDQQKLDIPDGHTLKFYFNGRELIGDGNNLKSLGIKKDATITVTTVSNSTEDSDDGFASGDDDGDWGSGVDDDGELSSPDGTTNYVSKADPAVVAGTHEKKPTTSPIASRNAPVQKPVVGPHPNPINLGGPTVPIQQKSSSGTDVSSPLKAEVTGTNLTQTQPIVLPVHNSAMTQTQPIVLPVHNSAIPTQQSAANVAVPSTTPIVQDETKASGSKTSNSGDVSNNQSASTQSGKSTEEE
eukprot:231035_1